MSAFSETGSITADSLQLFNPGMNGEHLEKQLPAREDGPRTYCLPMIL